jgi:hypothetical protein
MSRRRRAAGRGAGVALGVAVAAVGIAPRTAWAQSQTESQEAEARFKEGLRHHDTGDEEGARLSFLEAYSVLKRPNLLFNLARAEQLTGRFVDAISHYKAFAADSTVDPADRETARKHIVELSALVGHVQIDAPSGADLWIDGQHLAGKAPLKEPADVSAGPHTVQARLGDQTKMAGVSCEAGQTVTAKIEMEAMPDPALAGGPPTSGPGRLEPEESNRPVLHVASRGKIVTTVVLGTAAVAAIGVGVGMQLDASAKGSDVTNAEHGGGSSSCFGQTSVRCMQLSSDANAEATADNVRTGAFIGAGVLAVAAVVVWAAWPNSKVVESSRHVVPLVSPGFAGIGFVTEF